MPKYILCNVSLLAIFDKIPIAHESIRYAQLQSTISISRYSTNFYGIKPFTINFGQKVII